MGNTRSMALKPEAHEAFMAAFDATRPTDALVKLMSLHAEVTKTRANVVAFTPRSVTRRGEPAAAVFEDPRWAERHKPG